MGRMARGERWWAVVGAALVLLGPTVTAAEQSPAQRRVALVIGNAAYEARGASLTNPLRDANGMVAVLRDLDFSVVQEMDATKAEMERAANTFVESVRSGDVAVFYYSGHGMELDGTNYLAPVEFSAAWDEVDARHGSLNVNWVQEKMAAAGAAVRIVILDACRNNPFESTRTFTRGGLAGMSASGGLVAYAARAGEVADDDPGAENGLYTKHLLAALREPGLRVRDLFTRVRDAVSGESNGVQVPAMYDELVGDFVFRPGSIIDPDPPPPPQETVFWQSIVNSTNPEDFKAYLARWPAGTFASLARNRLADSPRPGEVFRDCPSCPEMVVIAAGAFRMGSPASEEARREDEGPQLRVTLRSFALGVTEVTFDEWEACVRGGGCGGRRPDDEGWGRGARPVINVNWEDARAYVRWLSRETGKSYRLPSEAEWEYAARGGTTTSWYWGDSSSGQCDHANGADAAAKRLNSDWTTVSCDDGSAYTAAAGSYEANAFRLFDMLGNVWEWVEDCWHNSYRGAPSDGTAWTRGGDCSRRVLRGGSWRSVPRVLRSALRSWSPIRESDLYVGFRVARTLD